jgi:hypothetical protein
MEGGGRVWRIVGDLYFLKRYEEGKLKYGGGNT